MKLEIKKEVSTTVEGFFYGVYLDNKFEFLETSEERALEKLAIFKRQLINPTAPELIYSEEF